MPNNKWKNIRKIDAHIHLVPDEVHQANPDSDDAFSYAVQDEHVRMMDEYNIEKSIIMTFNDPFLMSMDFSLDAVCRNLIEMCEKHPGKYYAFADIDSRLKAKENCEKLKEIMSNKCFKGIKIHPNNTGINIDDEYNDPVFELAESLDLPIAIHSYPASKKKYDNTDYCSPKRINNILKRHQNVKAIICHLGGFQWEDAIGLNAYFDISAILPDFEQEYGIVKTQDIVRQFGINRLLFATDFPCSRSLKPENIYDRYFEILDELGFSSDEIEKIAYQNIRYVIDI